MTNQPMTPNDQECIEVLNQVFSSMKNSLAFVKGYVAGRHSVMDQSSDEAEIMEDMADQLTEADESLDEAIDSLAALRDMHVNLDSSMNALLLALNQNTSLIDRIQDK